MAKNKMNIVRIKLSIEWPKGLFKAIITPLKKLFDALANFLHKTDLWLRSWPRL